MVEMKKRLNHFEYELKLIKSIHTLFDESKYPYRLLFIVSQHKEH